MKVDVFRYSKSEVAFIVAVTAIVVALLSVEFLQLITPIPRARYIQVLLSTLGFTLFTSSLQAYRSHLSRSATFSRNAITIPKVRESAFDVLVDIVMFIGIFAFPMMVYKMPGLRGIVFVSGAICVFRSALLIVFGPPRASYPLAECTVCLPNEARPGDIFEVAFVGQRRKFRVTTGLLKMLATSEGSYQKAKRAL